MLNYVKKLFNTTVNKTTAISFIDGFAYKHNRISPVDAYCKNIVVYRCVNLIAQTASQIPLLVFINNNNSPLDKSHPICQLLNKPNIEKGRTEFFNQLIANKLLFGNAYILSTSPHDVLPQNIILLNNNAIELIINEGQLIGYKYNSNYGHKTYLIDKLTRNSRILHIKSYNPYNSYVGLSCLDAANTSIDLHIKTIQWNCALLKNSARPSGALILKGNQYLTDEQFNRLQDQLVDKFSGANNTGRPLLLEGGFEWCEMGYNPKDMDFMEMKNSAARDIALAFGVPPQLLGIKGDATYNNIQAAHNAFWEETVIPLIHQVTDAFSIWLSNLCGYIVVIKLDPNSVSVLTEKRDNHLENISRANYMTINEKRAASGLGPILNGDVL